MANTHENLTSLFSDIANSIRAKTGGTGTLVADNFPSAIDAIETCPDDALFLEETQTTLPTSGYWRSIVYGNDKFVAVGEKGLAAYSFDGINWIQIAMPSSGWYHEVEYGNGVFVASVMNSDGAAYSTDGINWLSTTMPESSLGYLEYGNGMFVALNAGTTAAYSRDGISWLPTTVPASLYCRGIAYGNGKFVAVTTTGIIYSTDGINWSTEIILSDVSFQDIAYGNGKFVAVAESGGTIYYSVNGITWTSSTEDIMHNPRAITYGNGKFVMVLYRNSIVYYSTDGINWSTSRMPVSTTWQNVTYGNGKFVALTYNDDVIACSEDGINWKYCAKNSIVDVSGTDVTDETAEAIAPTRISPDDIRSDANVFGVVGLYSGTQVASGEATRESNTTLSGLPTGKNNAVVYIKVNSSAISNWQSVYSLVILDGVCVHAAYGTSRGVVGDSKLNGLATVDTTTGKVTLNTANLGSSTSYFQFYNNSSISYHYIAW